MLRKDLPIRNNLIDGTVGGGGTITVYANPIISPVRSNLLGNPGVGVIMPPPAEGYYPSSQIHRYTPASVNGSVTLWEDEIGSKDTQLFNCTFTSDILLFNGVNSYGRFNNTGNSLAPATGNWSWSVYYYSTGGTSSNRHLLSQGLFTPTTMYGAYLSSGASGDRAVGLVGTGTGAVILSQLGGIDASEFHHLVLTRSGNLFSLYLDGAFVGSATYAVTLSQVENFLGCLSSFTEFNAGGAKYIGICNTALTPFDVMNEYMKVITL